MKAGVSLTAYGSLSHDMSVLMINQMDIIIGDLYGSDHPAGCNYRPTSLRLTSEDIKRLEASKVLPDSPKATNS